MPTYAQLQAESYWSREIVTDEMDWLGDELCRRTNRPRAAAGTKGDNHHLRGAHRSQEWIKRSAYCTNRTYTVQSGLTADQERHVAGFDFTPGSATEMIAQCKRILAAMKAGKLNEVTEFYGNVDGDKIVDGWNNVLDKIASSDSSHLWHWHLTIDRRHCRNKKLMERILAIVLGLPMEGDDMSEKASQAIEAWARGNPKDAAGTSVEPVLWRIRDEAWQKRMEAKADATLAAAKGVDGAAIIARIDQRAAEDAQRDAALVELVRAGQSGELTAEQVLAKLRDLLPTGITANTNETPAE